MLIKSAFVTEKWFSRKVSYLDVLRLVMYKQYTGRDPGYFRKEPFHTMEIDLRDDEETIFSRFSKNCRYEVNRSRREGALFATESDIERFMEFYNKFADAKGMERITERFRNYADHLEVTKAVVGGRDMVMHSYLMDEDSGRVRQLSSVSLFRTVSDKNERRMLGRAKRFLHFEDIKYFKGKGYKVYDLGGYAFGTENEDLKNINKFKEGFGGKLVEHCHLTSPVLVAAMKIRGMRG